MKQGTRAARRLQTDCLLAAHRLHSDCKATAYRLQADCMLTAIGLHLGRIPIVERLPAAAFEKAFACE